MSQTDNKNFEQTAPPSNSRQQLQKGCDSVHIASCFWSDFAEHINMPYVFCQEYHIFRKSIQQLNNKTFL